MRNESGPLIALRDVVKDFSGRRTALGRARSPVRAVDGVSFEVPAGRSLALVGESGSGKSTVLKLAIGVESPTAGTVSWRGRNLDSFDRAAWRDFRMAVQPVFQDPWSSLNPRMRAISIVAEPLRCLLGMGRREAVDRAGAVLAEVGLGNEYLRRFPHEFSGGQRQRIAIARALAVRPRLVVLDEPVSALDVSVRAQILNLLKDMQDEHGLAYLIVSHEMTTVWSMSDMVAVMYRGRVMEIGDADAIRQDPRSPYTRRLMASVLPNHPRDRGQRRAPSPPGDTLGPVEEGGCRYQSRCEFALKRCRVEAPALRTTNDGRLAACHLV